MRRDENVFAASGLCAFARNIHHSQFTIHILVAEAVEQFLHLVVPKAALVLDLLLVGEILDDQDGLVGNFRFLDPELEILLLGGVGPMKADEFLFFLIEHFGRIVGAVPGETVDPVSFVHLISEPFLQAGGIREEVVKNGRGTSHRIFKGVKLFFAHLGPVNLSGCAIIEN
jgi:hypothetical protein